MHTTLIIAATLPIVTILGYLSIYAELWQDRAQSRLAVLCYLLVYVAFVV